MSNMSQAPEDILKRLGVKTTVTRHGPKPPGPGNSPKGGATVPSLAPPAASGGAEGMETDGAGVGGERDKNPGSLTSMTTYVEDISFLFQDLILCFPGCRLCLRRNFGTFS